MTLDYLGQQGGFPHPDHRILHAPGDCDLCDHYPAYQAERVAKMVCFTGKSGEWMQAEFGQWEDGNDPWTPCPYDEPRGTARMHWFWASRGKPTPPRPWPLSEPMVQGGIDWGHRLLRWVKHWWNQ